MMNLSKNSYSHIKSFEDFENEKMKLYFQMRLSEKKLQLKYVELSAFLNPMRFVPFLVSSWLKPLALSFKDLIFSFFRPSQNFQTSDEKSDEKSE
ncbi:hypothetical protein [Carboxylicivirga sp. M1479]|uniref:hypothetical protein n=1 Tax=Carboxylicivirga sp. M1479 TaxID=2594476 RepID=UPI00117806CF|nr:hypothetical protein [Carboxylicivirga sp. M1479]TRX70795.1 hypothetical protein FNN09_09910 [Carboxylicivirga sp. M1479]